MVNWCGNNSENDDNSIKFTHNGPTECFCYTIFVLLPSILMIFYLLISSTGLLYVTGWISPPQQVQTSSSSYHFYLLWSILIGCIVQPVLFIIFSLLENPTPAKAVAVGFHFLTWLLCGISIYYNYQHRIVWPSLAVNIYFCVSLAVCVIIVASLYSDKHISSSFILGVLIFIITLGLLILSYFKDSFILDEGETKYSPIYYPKNSSKPSFFQRLLGNKIDDEDEVVSFLDSDHESGGRLSDPIHSTSNRWSNASEDISLVKSMKEVRLSEGDSPPKPIVQSRVLTRMLENPQGSATSSKMKGKILGGLAPKGSQRADTNSMGGFTAAARAKADIRSESISRERTYHLENFRLLVEKWGLRREGYGHEEKVLHDEESEIRQYSERFSSIIQFDESERSKVGTPFTPLAPLDESDENSTHGDHSPSNNRLDRLSGELSSGSHKKSSRGSKSQEATITLLSRSNPSDSLGTPMEVEFEISVQNSDDGDENKTEKWTVWRTAKELLSLHAFLVGKFGDAAPRRPKLHSFFPPTVSVEHQSITKTLILSDMRIIAGYLRAVLSQPAFHCTALYSFLEIPISLANEASQIDSSQRNVNDDSKDEARIATISSSPPDQQPQPPELMRNRSAGLTDSQPTDNTKDQWRKVFLHLRKNLKPREVAVRCRVFDGVICGADIVKWMITSTNSHAHDQSEACLISQGLVAAELLVPVCLGYRNITDIDHDDFDPSTFAFSDEKGYVYRYPSGSKRTGSSTLFGAPVTIAIPRWIQVDGDGNISAAGGKDNNGAPYSTSGLPRKVDQNVSSGQSNSTPAGYVQYTIVIQVADDSWEVLRRYNEFSQFHRNLQKEKIKPNANFPSTSFSQLMMGQVAPVGEAKMDQRRQELELYLRSAIEAVLRTALQSDDHLYRDQLLTMLAEFLDDDHSRLRLVSNDFMTPEGKIESVGTTEQSLDSVSQAVGL